MKISGNKPYTIKYLKRVHREDIPSLPENIKVGIKKAVRERLTVDPIKLGKSLHHSLKEHKRLRVSNYRVIYRVNTVEHKVTVVAIGHRDTIVFSKMNDKLPLWYYQPRVVSLCIYTLEV